MASLSEQLKKGWALPADPQTSYANKTVLVTGSNSGLGHAAATKYAALGANPLILAVRSEEKGEAAKAAIIAATGCSPDVFIIEILEMSSFASVQDFFARLDGRVDKIHVAQLAAGMVSSSYTPGPDGNELSVQIDVLSTAQLALLLLPKMRGVPGACLSIVNSASHQMVLPAWTPTDSGLVKKLNDPATFDVGQMYLLIKLAGMFTVRAMAEMVSTWPEGERVVVNATCPGMCRTDQARNFGAMARWSMSALYWVIGRSAEQGSRSLVSATGLGGESHGRFWTNDEYVEPSPFMKGERGEKSYQNTWEEIRLMLQPHVPEGLV